MAAEHLSRPKYRQAMGPKRHLYAARQGRRRAVGPGRSATNRVKNDYSVCAIGFARASFDRR